MKELGVLPCVEQLDVARRVVRFLAKSVANLVVKIARTFFHMVGRPLFAQCRLLWVQIEQKAKTRLDAPRRERTGLPQKIRRDPAGMALISHGRQGEAVGQHDFPTLERRADLLLHELGPAGEEKECFTCEADAKGTVQEEVSQLIAQSRSARIAHPAHRKSSILQGPLQPVDLRGFPRPIDPFHGDEVPAALRLGCLAQTGTISSAW